MLNVMKPFFLLVSVTDVIIMRYYGKKWLRESVMAYLKRVWEKRMRIGVGIGYWIFSLRLSMLKR